MKALLALLVVMPLGLGMIACGDTSRVRPVPRHSSGSVTTAHPIRNYSVLGFGHGASPGDRRTVTRLVKRYYAAAAAEDGATACSLIPSNLARAVPEDYGQAPGPRYLRGGKTCSAVMSRLFTYLHRRMASEAATLKVTRVRLKSKGGYAVLRFNAPPERELNVVREGGTWKVGSLLDSDLF